MVDLLDQFSLGESQEVAQAKRIFRKIIKDQDHGFSRLPKKKVSEKKYPAKIFRLV